MMARLTVLDWIKLGFAHFCASRRNTIQKLHAPGQGNTDYLVGLDQAFSEVPSVSSKNTRLTGF